MANYLLHLYITLEPEGKAYFPESVKLEYCKMLEMRTESNVSGISTVIFSAPIWRKFINRDFFLKRHDYRSFMI